MTATLLALWTHPLTAGDEFDPKTYIQTKDSVAVDPIEEGEVSIKGTHYTVFKSPAGNLYIPSMSKVDKSSIEGGLCANQTPLPLEKCLPDDVECKRRNMEMVSSEVTILRADTPLSDNVKLYAEILTTTIQRKCGDVAPKYFLPLIFKPEIGVEYKDVHKRNPTTYKLYMDPTLIPGFKAEF